MLTLTLMDLPLHPHRMGIFQFDLLSPAKFQRPCSQQELNGCYTLLTSQKMVGCFYQHLDQEGDSEQVLYIKCEGLFCRVWHNGLFGQQGLCGSELVYWRNQLLLCCRPPEGDGDRRSHQVSEIFLPTVLLWLIQSYDDINPLPRTIIGHE